MNVPLVAMITCLRMKSVKRRVIIKTATWMEEIVMNVLMVAIIVCLRMMSVKRHAII